MAAVGCVHAPPGEFSSQYSGGRIENRNGPNGKRCCKGHGSGFFLLAATKLSSPMDSYSTDVQLLSDEDDGSEHTGSLSTLVFPLRSAVHIVTVGRASKNDVVITDPSVSRVHALLKRDEKGVFLMLDAGSSNGTTVNGASVLTRGNGPPSQLKPGDNVRLGRVEFTFTDAAALQDFVVQTG